MGRFLSVIGLCWVLMMVSCHHQQEENAWVELVPSDSIELDMGMPVELYLLHDMLFVIDTRYYDNFIQVFDLPTKQYLFSFASYGDEFGKCLSASLLDFYTEDGEEKVELYDFNTKMLTYDFASLLRDKNKAMPEQERKVWEEYPFVWNVYKTNEGYVASGKFYYERETLIQENGTIRYEKTDEPQGGKFALLNDSLQFVKYVGTMRPKPQPDISDNVHNLANYGFQGLSPNRRYLADCISAAQILTLYELKEEDVVKQWEYVAEELDYVPMGLSSFVAKSKEGYSHASLTNELVYALLVGEAEDDEIGHYEREIHVFDIQTGEIVTHYLLDRPTRNILVKDGKLYTIPDSPETQILVYDLK